MRQKSWNSVWQQALTVVKIQNLLCLIVGKHITWRYSLHYLSKLSSNDANFSTEVKIKLVLWVWSRFWFNTNFKISPFEKYSSNLDVTRIRVWQHNLNISHLSLWFKYLLRSSSGFSLELHKNSVHEKNVIWNVIGGCQIRKKKLKPSFLSRQHAEFVTFP